MKGCFCCVLLMIFTLLCAVWVFLARTLGSLNGGLVQ
jgi:hypothetical protein